MLHNVPWIEPVSVEDTVLANESVTRLLDRWDTTNSQGQAVVAVVNERRQMVGIVTPLDVLNFLLHFGMEVYHLWPFTHVVPSGQTWRERLDALRRVPVRRLVQKQGAVSQVPSDWGTALAALFQADGPVLWICDGDGALYGKVTPESLWQARPAMTS